MSGLEIGLLCGLIASLVVLTAMVWYVKWNRKTSLLKIQNQEIDIKSKKTIYIMFTKWLIVFLFFFVILSLIFCSSMLIVELTK